MRNVLKMALGLLVASCLVAVGSSAFAAPPMGIAGSAVTATATAGDVLCTSLNRPILKTIDGTHFKWETREISDGISLPGANFNAYANGGRLAFYWPNSSSGNAGVAATSAGKDWLVLRSGDQIGPGSLFSDGAAAAQNWVAGVDGYLGFRFNCSTAGACYGYAHMSSTGPNGFPATLMGYCFNSVGNGITIPSSGIFCNSFENGEDGSCGPISDLVTGMVNLPLADDPVGSSFDFLTGDVRAYSGGRIDDINLYRLGSSMYVYWYTDKAPLNHGGVVDAGGDEFAVLQSGDVVGPNQTFSSSSRKMSNWIGGTDGYIGVAFQNEHTGELNYGYIRMVTSSPGVYPVKVLEYGYSRTGSAVMIP